MASHHPTFGASILDLVSGVEKLQVTAQSTYEDFKRWERDLFKVLDEQGLLHHLEETASRGVAETFNAERALALALVCQTLDSSVTDRLDSCTKRHPGNIYDELLKNYIGFVEEEKAHQEEGGEKCPCIHTRMASYHWAHIKESLKKRDEALAMMAFYAALGKLQAEPEGA